MGHLAVAAAAAYFSVKKTLLADDKITEHIGSGLKKHRFKTVVEIVGKKGYKCTFGWMGYVLYRGIDHLHLVDLHHRGDAFVLIGGRGQCRKGCDALNTETFKFFQIFRLDQTWTLFLA